jgi:hypothetical protein
MQQVPVARPCIGRTRYTKKFSFNPNGLGSLVARGALKSTQMPVSGTCFALETTRGVTPSGWARRGAAPATQGEVAMGSFYFFGFSPPERVPVETNPRRKRRRPPREPDPNPLMVWIMGLLAFAFAFGIAMTI